MPLFPEKRDESKNKNCGMGYKIKKLKMMYASHMARIETEELFSSCHTVIGKGKTDRRLVGVEKLYKGTGFHGIERYKIEKVGKN